MASKDDHGMEDAADYFSTVLMRVYPDVSIEQYRPKPHRIALKIIVPPQTEYEISDIDGFAFMFMQQLYGLSDCRYLIAYTVEREQGEEDGSD